MTSRLTNDQSMAYLRLLWMYYDNESPIENDVDAIAFKIGAVASDVHQILKHFFTQDDDGKWRNSRCDREIDAYHKKSKSGRVGANARWNNANALQTHSERIANEPVSHANQEPRTNNQEPINREKSAQPKGSRLQSDFELPESWKVWAKEHRSDLSIENTFDGFKDFWIAKAGKDASKMNWEATWRNWVRNQKQALHFGVPVVVPMPVKVWKPEPVTPASLEIRKAALASVNHLLKNKIA